MAMPPPPDYRAMGLDLTAKPRPPSPDQARIDAFLTEFESRMLGLALRTRTPGWLNPPRSAVNLRWSINDDLAGPGAGAASSRAWGVRWTQTPESATVGLPPGFSTLNNTDAIPEPFPTGSVGIVWVRCTAAQVSTSFGAVNVMRQARWSLLHNGGFVPGFLRAMPGGNAGMRQNPTAAATFVANDHGFHDCITACPIIVKDNDTMGVVFHTDEINAGVTVNFHCSVFGWQVPLSHFDLDAAAESGR